MLEISQIFTKISSEILTRHYGISNQINLSIIKISMISTGKIHGKLLCIKLKDNLTKNDTDIYLWGSRKSKSIFFPLTIETKFFTDVLNSLNHNFVGEINLIGNIPQNWDITEIRYLKMDVTNFHFIIHSKEKKYRLKWYSRPNYGYREFTIQRKLNKLEISPRAEFLIAHDKNAIFGIYEEMENVRNLDTLTGEKYTDLINSKLTLDQFFLEMRSFFIEITRLILHLQKVETSLLEKNVIQPYSALEWYKNLKNDWKKIKNSNLFSNEEVENFKNLYMPLLKKFLEETDSGLIHGDIWMRQFGMSLLTNQLQLFDFEDMKMGPKSFDFACQINSIAQQYEYFRIKFENENLLSREYGQTLIETFISTLPSISNEFEKEIHYCQCFRMIHELRYLLDHQPEEKWLFSFIRTSLISTLDNL